MAIFTRSTVPHSLFADTIRSLRSLAIAHRLGHVLKGENDRRISLLERLVHHAAVTAEYNVYYGEGRDAYDVRGRVAHESIFNTADGVTAALPHSRAIRRSPRGRGRWPGSCAGTRNNWSFSKQFLTPNWSRSVDATKSKA